MNVKNTLKEMKDFDNQFDKYLNDLNGEIFDIKMTVNKQIIKDVWNAVIEASAYIAESKMPNTVPANIMAFEIRKELKIL